MAKKKSRTEETDKPGSRSDIKYVGLPVELWKKLKAWADKDERSVNWAARKIIGEFFAKEE